ncbi:MULTISPECIES: heparinase II/III family protein [unclassified Spirosoma]|uniref:heparinase II/III domain-containing protein n=1 Tax=unclassified Spirosoma TaxID=2621999 RepID=UPI00096985FA|nr:MULTISPECIES: heparinase II/III family protein [unclassified Spirosoma]MBN8824015.1 heparinase II/III family protein [Spirosoma sp.]OJW70422.1 MAG: heparinase [Spirosoma sp. 48-14]
MNRTCFCVFCLFFLTTISLYAQVDHLANTNKLAAHPRLLLLAGEEAGIKRTLAADKTWTNLHQAILVTCDELVDKAPLERIKIGRRLLSVSREALRRVFYLSYAWRLTQQDKYLKRAEKELLALSAFDDWNPTHFLDVAEMTMAVAIGYDWLYNDLPDQSRSLIKDAILKKGIQPSLDTKYNSWLKASHNWNQVCNAGMAYGALAIADDQPGLTKTIINRAIDSVVLPMGDYRPDGAYPEGYSYWGYGTSFNVMLISALEKAYGSDFGLSKQPGFLQTAAYLENMTGPSGNAFNYSDSGLSGELQPAMFWFAQKQNNPSLLWVERDRLMTNDPKRHTGERLLPAIMLWSNGIGMSAITAPKTMLWVGEGKNPVALMRTSWSDPAALFVGLKTGSPSVNHAHMDIGSFVMEADGVRWAMDFGMQNYESLESKGVDLWNSKQDSQRWQIFRYNNLAHNTLTVNNQLQRVTGRASVSRSSANPSFLNAQTDLSDIYRESLAKAIRGVAIVDKAYVVVRDELEALTTETTVRWTMLTPASVSLLGGNKAELTKDGKKLILEVVEPAGVTLKTWSTEPPHDYDAANPGTIRIGFEVTLPASSKTALTVRLLPEKASNSQKAIQSLGQWPR